MARVEPYLSDYGITRVAHLTGFDLVGVPVHMAVKPQGKSLSSGSGKGVTPEGSWMSAVMECSEQAVWEGLAPGTLTGSQAALRRDGLITVDGAACPQYRGSLWHEDSVIGWLEGWDLVHAETVWVPESLVTIPHASAPRSRPFVGGTNGLASGMHVLEALASALLEVIERDGLALHTSVTHGPDLDATELLASASPYLAERLARARLPLRVVDATTEVGIPTVVAVVHGAPGTRVGRFKGAGAGMNRATALVRAVTEALQGRCLIIAGARDDQFESQRRAATAIDAPPPEATTGILTADDDTTTSSLVAAIDRCVTSLTSCGFDRVVCIRHSTPSDPVQVVRVIVPGLEGYPFDAAAFGPRARAFRAERSPVTS